MVVVLDLDGTPGVQRSFEDDGGVAGAWGEGARADIGDRGGDDCLGARTAGRIAEQRALVLAVQHAILRAIGGIIGGDREKKQAAAIGKGTFTDALDDMVLLDAVICNIIGKIPAINWQQFLQHLVFFRKDRKLWKNTFTHTQNMDTHTHLVLLSLQLSSGFCSLQV